MAEGIFGRAIEAGGRLLVRSALNPILWLCAIIYPTTIVAFIIRPDLPAAFLWFGVAPIAFAVIGFVYFMIRDPDKLQSEEFQIRKKTIEFSQQKGDSHPVAIDVDNVAVVPRPVEIDSAQDVDSVMVVSRPVEITPAENEVK